MRKFTFKLPVGDWSGDGHSQCEYTIISSNVPVAEVREAYLEITEKLQFGLDGNHIFKGVPFADYEDSKLTSDQIAKLGLDVEAYREYFKDSIEEEFEDESGVYYEVDYLGPDEFVDLFIDFMQVHAPHIKLEIIPENHVDMFPFYGSDDKGRHIGHMGYGLFSH
jgi:hypothetical protein